MIYKHIIRKEALGYTLAIEELKVVSTELSDLVEIDYETFNIITNKLIKICTER